MQHYRGHANRTCEVRSSRPSWPSRCSTWSGGHLVGAAAGPGHAWLVVAGAVASTPPARPGRTPVATSSPASSAALIFVVFPMLYTFGSASPTTARATCSTSSAPPPTCSTRRRRSGKRYSSTSTPTATGSAWLRSITPTERREPGRAATPAPRRRQPARLATPADRPGQGPAARPGRRRSPPTRSWATQLPLQGRHPAAACARAAQGEVPGRRPGQHGLAARVRAAAAGLPEGGRRRAGQQADRRGRSPPTSRPASTRPPGDGEQVRPGFKVDVGFANYVRVFTDRALAAPLFRIFVWTVIFSGLTVLFTLAVGMTLAVLLNWEALQFRTFYRTAALPALRRARLHLDPGLPRPVQPELRRDQPDPRAACSASSRPGSPIRSWPSA